jgi:heavy-metal-associated domain-containing protein
MAYAASAARVEQQLNAVDSVSATVSPVTGTATVTAPVPVRLHRLIEVAEQAGYNAELLARGEGGPGGDGVADGARGVPDADRVTYLRSRR